MRVQMKTLTGMIMILGLTSACQSTSQGLSGVEGSSSSSSSSNTGGSGSSSSCAFDTMTKNGAHAADPDRTSYTCYFDDDNSSILFTFNTDTGGYVQFQGGTMDFRRWKVDSAACVMTIYVHETGEDLYYIDDITLDVNNRLKTGSFYHIADNTTRTFSQCYYDTTPGF